jgi:hypothetical protein
MTAAGPLDRDKLLRLGELMVAVADGSLKTRDPLMTRVRELMASLRGSPAGAKRVVDRLLAIASAGLGPDGNALMGDLGIQCSVGLGNHMGALQ